LHPLRKLDRASASPLSSGPAWIAGGLVVAEAGGRGAAAGGVFLPRLALLPEPDRRGGAAAFL